MFARVAQLFRFGGSWREFAAGSVWSALGLAASQGAALAAGFAVARSLGPAEYGRFGLIQSTIALWAIASDMGLGVAAMRLVGESGPVERHLAGRIVAGIVVLGVGLSVLSAGALWLLAPLIAGGAATAPELTPLFRIASGTLLLSTLASLFQGILGGFSAFPAVARANMFRGVVLVPLSIVGVREFGLTGAISAMFAGYLASLVSTSIDIVRVCQARGIVPVWSLPELPIRRILAVSVPAFLSSLAITPANWVVHTLLSRSPDGFKELGLYTAGMQYRTVVLLTQAVTGNVLMPMMAGSRAERQRDILRSAVYLQAAIGFVALVLAAAMAGPLAGVFGREFSGNGAVVVLGVATGVAGVTGAPMVTWLTVTNRQWTVTGWSIFGGVCLVGFSTFCITRGLGAAGVAASAAAAGSLQLAGLVWSTSRVRRQQCQGPVG